MPSHRAATGNEALGRSPAFVAFQDRLSRAARVDRPVLLLGERGTGKELAAHRLHYLSTRWEERFVALNCASMTPTLITAELFGHEAGAFTGAGARRTGRFEAADRGTLFLDELASLPMDAQEMVLRVVEYGVFERVGSVAPVRVDVRLVAAAHGELVQMADRGRFRADLLDRLSFEVLVLPPLRERHGDIPLLVDHFAARMAAEMGRAAPPRFSPKAMAALEGHAWPGNVRELKNAVERAVYRAESDTIDTVELDPFAAFRQPAPAPEEGAASAAAPASPLRTPRETAPDAATPNGVTLPCSLVDEVETLQRGLVEAAMERARHNQRRAAALLGLRYHQFRGLYRKLAGPKSPASGAPESERPTT